MLGSSNRRIQTVQEKFYWSDGTVRSYPEPEKK